MKYEIQESVYVPKGNIPTIVYSPWFKAPVLAMTYTAKSKLLKKLGKKVILEKDKGYQKLMVVSKYGYIEVVTLLWAAASGCKLIKPIKYE